MFSSSSRGARLRRTRKTAPSAAGSNGTANGPDTNGNADTVIIAQVSASQRVIFSIARASDENRLDLTVYDTGGNTTVETGLGVVLPIDTWAHLAIVIDGDNDSTKLYVDGVETLENTRAFGTDLGLRHLHGRIPYHRGAVILVD